MGLLVSGIMDSFTEDVSRGVMRAARQADVNLVVIPCKYIDRDLSDQEEIKYEYQYNTMLTYARRENLDALLIMADCIGCHTTRDRIRQMLTQYEGIPSVLIATKMDGYVSISYDNFAGIQEGLAYLLEHLHCQRFCMLGGPDGNMDARERRQAFVSFLTEHGIELEERNFVEGDLSRSDTAAFRRLLDKNPDAQAIFCVNDDSAIGLCEELIRRGKMPGRDVYLFGYDNTVFAAKLEPSLSSIWADSAQMGMQSLEMLLQMYEGRQVQSRVLPTKFIKRDSFGREEKLDRSGMPILDLGRMEDYFDDIFYRCKNEELGDQIQDIRDSFRAMMVGTDALVKSSGSVTGLYQEFLGLLDEFFASEALPYADIDKLTLHLHRMYQAIITGHPRQSADFNAPAIVAAIYQKFVNALDSRFLTMKDADRADNYAMKLFVSDSMQFRSGNDLSYTALLRRLSWLEIQNAYVYIYDKPILHLYQEPFTLPETLYLKAALENGQVRAVPKHNQAVSFRDLYRIRESDGRRSTRVMLPLFSNETLYGAMLCDLTDKVFENGEFLTNQLSSAVKMIHLLNENEKIQQQLEESLITLRENNIELDHLSKSDMLTGILNRRGFYDEAERFLETNRNAGKQCLVIYVDMNNLKVINDRYGHEEGDYALKTIGQILLQTLRSEGLAGRIGGDEFACVMKYGWHDGGRKVLEELEEKFNSHNRQSQKPYNVTVSAGICSPADGERPTLMEMLSLADEELYRAKKNKVTVVEK